VNRTKTTEDLNIMKKLVIALMVTATAAISFAQEPEPGTFHRHGQRLGLHRLGAQLNLTDAQKQQMKEIRSADRESNKQLYADFRAKLQELRALRQANDPGAAAIREQVASMKTQIQAARRSNHEAILGVLTAEQREELKTARQSRGMGGMDGMRGMGGARGMGRNRGMGGMRGMQGHRGGALRGAVASKLNLTDDQKTQLHQLRETTHSKNQQLFADAQAKRQELRSLRRANDPRAEDVKAQLEALRPQLKAARDEQHTAFLSILTPEQRTQLEQWKSQREQRLR
jgi:Spy/CpxP family protein refolding chaperone